MEMEMEDNEEAFELDDCFEEESADEDFEDEDSSQEDFDSGHIDWWGKNEIGW
jgi:hypothetical protein